MKIYIETIIKTSLLNKSINRNTILLFDNPKIIQLIDSMIEKNSQTLQIFIDGEGDPFHLPLNDITELKFYFNTTDDLGIKLAHKIKEVWLNVRRK
jgi:hypothetical protein